MGCPKNIFGLSARVTSLHSKLLQPKQVSLPLERKKESPQTPTLNIRKKVIKKIDFVLKRFINYADKTI